MHSMLDLMLQISVQLEDDYSSFYFIFRHYLFSANILFKYKDPNDFRNSSFFWSSLKNT